MSEFAYTALGVEAREDLLDMITNISPTERPLLAMLPRVPASNIKHEWLEDALTTADTAGALEGAAFSKDTIASPTRRANWCQINRREFTISGTNESVTHAGMSSQIGYHTRKTMEELANDTEATLIQGVADGSTPQGSSTVGRTMDGLSDVAGNSETGVGTTDDITETQVNSLLEALWDDGVYADTVLASKQLKKSISNFTTYISGSTTAATGTSRIHHDGGVNDPRAIVKNVLMYEGDFGVVDIYLSRYVAAADQGYAFARRYLRHAVLRPTMIEEMGRRGDGTDMLMLHETTLEYGSPNAIGKWVIA